MQGRGVVGELGDAVNMVLVSYANEQGVRVIRAHVNDFVLQTQVRVTNKRMLIKNAAWDIVCNPYPLASENSIGAATLAFNAMDKAEHMVGGVMGAE